MFGRLFNTLRSRLDAEEKEWQSLNQLRGELEPNLWHSSVLRVASKPFLFGGTIFLLVSILALVTALVDSKYWVIYYVSKFEKPDPVAYFSALWSVQAAVAALVYPIVIAFVTLLVGQRNNANAALHIYLHDSAALLAGLSALLLVAEMGLQYFGVPYVSTTTLMAWLHGKALADTPPSQHRLSEVGQWASTKAFAKETAACPIPLFSEVLAIGEPLTARSLVINGMKKGEFTDPPMADRAVNEEEWFAETVRDHVAFTVLAAVLDELKPGTLNTDTPEAYWAQIKKYANDASTDGLHPVLLLENPTLPGCVWDWVHPPFDESVGTAPPDLVVSKDGTPNIDGYQWSLNDIPVFNAPLPPGASVLVVRESFERIEFSRLPDGRWVTADTKAVQGHPGLVDLVLTWQMRTTVKKYPSVRLSYDVQS